MSLVEEDEIYFKTVTSTCLGKWGKEDLIQ